ncbi:dnaK-type molecular chaperone bipA [Ephemerocybe angulata]|uniref:DnaK-type molecular chaperone bipA n=1 Tax=Ephemerocybe angulata TaxID=980116 RepID=A0A8H6M5G0_9AGAR|nr:dnaK-type molecular chaperone bipA [Tulosesus angulatus]
MSKTATGTSTPSAIEFNSFAPVVGINFGNSYASIAVLGKDGNAECIANEDGERQIACAISFHGEETYIGNQAKAQLVKNSANTITNFRNLLGLSYSSIPPLSSPPTSAPIIQHPTQPDVPAYRVSVLEPAPAPLKSNVNTPAATPRSEPVQTTRVLTPADAATIFLKSLLTSAEAFLGKKVEAAVLTVPSWMSPAQRAALASAAKDAGIPVTQLLEEAAAVASTTSHTTWTDGVEEGTEIGADRSQLVVDVGATSSTISLLSVRQGLSYVIASSTIPQGANAIDDKLIKHFAADFTKKTKIPLQVAPAPASSVADQRAEARLRLAIEHTKRTLSASPGAATCSVESLKDGFDYTGSINRMRFDMVAAPVYTAIASAVVELLASAGVDSKEVGEIVYVGGTGSLPGLDERVQGEVVTPFSRGIVQGGGIGDPTTILARGSAIQAAMLAGLPSGTAEDKELHDVILGEKGEQVNKVKATTRTIGVLFPTRELGGVFVPVVQKETALPTRRVVQVEVALPAEGEKRVCLEVWEVKEGIRIEKIKAEPTTPIDEDEDEEEEEEEEVKHKVISKEILLGALQIAAKGAKKAVVQVQVVVGIEGEVDVEVKEVGEGAGEPQRVHVPAP